MSEPIPKDVKLSVRELIVGLRGEIPAKCDFCHRATHEDDLHPEEAGMWICIKCIEKIGY